MTKTRQHICTEQLQLYRKYRPLGGVRVSQEDIQQFLVAYEGLDRVEGTLQLNRQKLKRFYKDLPEDRIVRHDTLKNWREKLLQSGYAPNSVNAFLSAANTFLDFIGHREYQLAGQLREDKAPAPELSRMEYLYLLRTAKVLGKERVYLLMKVFATTGIQVRDLQELTVEAIREGRIVCRKNRCRQTLTVPKCLQKEMLSFAERNGIQNGPVFLTRDGRPIHRTYISGMMKPICEAAQITDGRGSPKCLRKLYFSTRAAIENDVALLVDQAMERQLEQEQFSIGWEES